MTHIPYKGVGQFIPDLLSGNVDVGLVTPPTINPHYSVGQVKVLAQSGPKRHALLPHVPTRTVFHGVLPFMVADVVRLFILVAFPVISLWLPSLMR